MSQVKSRQKLKCQLCRWDSLLEKGENSSRFTRTAKNCRCHQSHLRINQCIPSFISSASTHSVKHAVWNFLIPQSSFYIRYNSISYLLQDCLEIKILFWSKHNLHCIKLSIKCGTILWVIIYFCINYKKKNNINVCEFGFKCF